MNATAETPVMSQLTPSYTKKQTRTEKIDMMKRIGMNTMLAPRAVLRFALNLISTGSSGMTTAHTLDTFELIIVNALSTGDKAVADDYLKRLVKRFGTKCNRVRYLQGLTLEFEGKLAEAKRLYYIILKENPMHSSSIKRLSVMEKSQGNVREAIRVLENDLVFVDDANDKHTFSEVQRADIGAYAELAVLYHQLGNVGKAIHYTEEQILFDNDNFALHIRLGELFYQQKDFAKSAPCYAHAIMLNPHHARALYGLRQSIKRLLDAHRNGSVKMDPAAVDMWKGLHALSAEKLKERYEGASPKVLDAFLASTSIE